MDTFSAFRKAIENRHREQRVFDWNKAASIIKERKAQSANAGLAEDYEWTGGEILSGGKPVLEKSTYLSSSWATPTLIIDDDWIECFKMQHEVPDWNADTFWPASALSILESKENEV